MSLKENKLLLLLLAAAAALLLSLGRAFWSGLPVFPQETATITYLAQTLSSWENEMAPSLYETQPDQSWEKAPDAEETPSFRNGLIAVVLFAAGTLLTLWFLLTRGEPWAYGCPELELTGALLALALMRHSPDRFWMVAAWSFAGILVSLLLLRSFVCRLPRSLRLRHTLAGRLGGWIRSFPILVGAELALGALAAIPAVLLRGSLLWLCVTVGLGLIPLACILAGAWEADRLASQIRRAERGEAPELLEGFFAGESQALARLRAEREEAVETARRDERFKVELITNVSHDLRTPLTAILGCGELLRGEQLSPEGEKHLALLNRKAGYMRDLVEELFELTKVSSGVSAPEPRELDLIRLLEQTIGLLEDRLEGLELRRFYPAEQLPVLTDGARMHRVFDNLLQNAIKYAMPGTRIYLNVVQEPEWITVRFTNTASYDMDFRPEEIVQRFVRGDKTRSSQGSGIGLAIAQTYTESCGGCFHVEVDGDQFRAVVELPVERKL